MCQSVADIGRSVVVAAVPWIVVVVAKIFGVVAGSVLYLPVFGP